MTQGTQARAREQPSVLGGVGSDVQVGRDMGKPTVDFC